MKIKIILRKVKSKFKILYILSFNENNYMYTDIDIICEEQ